MMTGKSGAIWLYANNAAQPLGSIPNVNSGGERGLLSIAADPSFSRNGYVYVYYTHVNGSCHVERLTCTGDIATPNSPNLALSSASTRVVLSSLPDIWPVHNGGSLRFGLDGMLYITVGDDNFPCAAQDVNSKRGCLLRVDVRGLPPGPSLLEPDYSLLDPGDNPLSRDTGFSRLVIGHGLRNPFRMEIDPITGDIYIGDVGEDLEEEISRYKFDRGALELKNFGWPWREGLSVGPFTCGGSAPQNMQDPIATELNSIADSIIAGAIYRNRGGNFDFGNAYEANLFYMDWFQGYIRRVESVGASGWGPSPSAAGQPNATDWAIQMKNAGALRLGPDGALWFVQLPWWAQPESRLARFRPTNLPTTSISITTGASQIGAAATTFQDPVEVTVTDANGQPLSNVNVGFEIMGPGEFVGQPTVRTDANGNAEVTVRALDRSGEIYVLASTPGASARAQTSLYSRRLTVTASPSQLQLRIDNQTNAAASQVNYFVTMSLGGGAGVPTPIGPLCINPYAPQSVVIEDATGIFNYISYSGLGAVGTPSLQRTYALPPGLLAGMTTRFEAVGYDPITSWFITNCEVIHH